VVLGSASALLAGAFWTSERAAGGRPTPVTLLALGLGLASAGAGGVWLVASVGFLLVLPIG
jgi:hypothetical protein